jgi:hypothetical protein
MDPLKPAHESTNHPASEKVIGMEKLPSGVKKG